MTHINRKIIITIDGEKGQSGKTLVEITENGKPKTRFEWTEATFTSMILMEIATDILCACHEDMMKHWMKYNHVPDAGEMVEQEHIADVSNMMDRPEVDEDERMRMLFDCLGSDCTLNRKLLEANGCSIEEMLAFIEKEREEAEKRHERIEQRWKEVQEIDRSMRELRKNLFGEEKEPKPAEWSEEEKRKLNRIYQILGWAADTHAYSMTCQLIGDKEAIELQDFLRSIAKPGDRPAEWSEEDGTFLEEALWCVLLAKHFVPEYVCDPDTRTSAEKWLKSLPKRLKSLRSRPKSSDNLPKWKKASAGTKLPSESVIRAEGQDPRFGSVAVYDCEYITINELEKLPKED